MSSHEFTEWQAYDLLEPIGTSRLDYLAGVICATIANVNRDPDKVPDPYKPEDFIPKFQPEFLGRETEEEEFTPKHSPRELYANLRTWALLSQIQKKHVNNSETPGSPGA